MNNQIKIFDLKNQSFVAAIDSLTYPRDIAILDNDKAILSSPYCDAADYVQNGYFYIYSTTGFEPGSYRSGIIPGKMCFN